MHCQTLAFRLRLHPETNSEDESKKIPQANLQRVRQPLFHLRPGPLPPPIIPSHHQTIPYTLPTIQKRILAAPRVKASLPVLNEKERQSQRTQYQNPVWVRFSNRYLTSVNYSVLSLLFMIKYIGFSC